jgi:hypothetical protein
VRLQIAGSVEQIFNSLTLFQHRETANRDDVFTLVVVSGRQPRSGSGRCRYELDEFLPAQLRRGPIHLKYSAKSPRCRPTQRL